MDSEENTDKSEEKKEVTINCPHCNKSFKLEDVEEVECSNCNTVTISILTKKCKDPNCENVYCKDCLDNLNKYGYCGDCENVSCSSCGGDIDRGAEITCPKCKTDFCSDCAPEMIDSELGCVDCIDSELVVECNDSNCSKTVLKSKAVLCKNFEECGVGFCKEHVEGNINENGYCDDCATFSCYSCENDFDRDKKVTCTKCEANFCSDCAKEAIDEEGCINCLSVEVLQCSDENCSKSILESKAVLCKNFNECGNAYCHEHSSADVKDNGLCEECNSFRCDNCQNSFPIEKAVKCSNVKCKDKSIFCEDCSKLSLDSSGLCISCSIKNSVRCASCGKKTFIEQATKCENCDDYLCVNCNHKMTECSKCHKKVCPNCARRCVECRKTTCLSCGDIDRFGVCSDHKHKEKEISSFEDQEPKTFETKKEITVSKSRKEIRESEAKKESKQSPPKKEGFWAWFKREFL